MSEKQNRLVWSICFYLSFVYFALGLTGYLAWQQSEAFSVIGWSWDNPNAGMFQAIVFSLCAGGLGAVSYGFWMLFRHHCVLKKFDSIWIIWYVFGPVSGSLLGIATYAVVVGGLLVLGENISLRSNWAIFALSFLAGFSAKRILRKLHAVAGKVFEQETEKSQHDAEKNQSDEGS